MAQQRRQRRQQQRQQQRRQSTSTSSSTTSSTTTTSSSSSGGSGGSTMLQRLMKQQQQAAAQAAAQQAAKGEECTLENRELCVFAQLTLRDVLRVKELETSVSKRPSVLKISSHESVLTASKLMQDHEVGALLVKDNGACHGLLNERDCLRAFVHAHERREDVASLRVSQLIDESSLIGIRAEDSVTTAMSIFARSDGQILDRVRYLLVLQNLHDENDAVSRHEKATLRHLLRWQYTDSPDWSDKDAMRALPVVHSRHLLGVVSVNDVMRLAVHSLERYGQILNDYVHGTY
jgi:CBS domain-containing protein